MKTLQRASGQQAVAEEHQGEGELVARLRAGDEKTFVELVTRLGPSMLRVARLYVRGAQAEEVVQETWLSVFRSIDDFEGRSSLRNWIFAILANCGRRRAAREPAWQPLDDDEPAVSCDRFFPASHPRWGGMWSTRVDDWRSVPEDRLLASEGGERLRAALAQLPEAQSAVFVLRDVEGWTSHEVCELLSVTMANQRVLLHRARASIRAKMEEYLEERGE